MPRTQGAPVPFSFLVWAGVGDRELAEDTGLARSAYMSSESTLCTELLLDVALDTEETLLTLRDLDTHKPVCPHVLQLHKTGRGWRPQWGFLCPLSPIPIFKEQVPTNLKFQRGFWIV